MRLRLALALILSCGAAEARGFQSRCRRPGVRAELYCRRGEKTESIRALEAKLTQVNALHAAAKSLEQQAAAAKDAPSAEAARETAAELEALKKEAREYSLRQQRGYEQVTYELAKQAEAGELGLAWGDDVPKPIGPNTELGRSDTPIGVTLWDGSEAAIAKSGRVLVEECKPCKPCKQRLKFGAMHFETVPYHMDYQRHESKRRRDCVAPSAAAAKPAAGGAASPAPSVEAGAPEAGPGPSASPSGYQLAAGALTLAFNSAQLVAHAGEGGKTTVAVISGEVEAKTAEGERVTLKAGETLQAEPGKPLELPQTADMEKLDKWWDEVQ